MRVIEEKEKKVRQNIVMGERKSADGCKMINPRHRKKKNSKKKLQVMTCKREDNGHEKDWLL